MKIKKHILENKIITNNFQSDKSTRDKVIYAGANNGILHAFDASNGKEIWGFVPPLIAQSYLQWLILV